MESKSSVKNVNGHFVLDFNSVDADGLFFSKKILDMVLDLQHGRSVVINTLIQEFDDDVETETAEVSCQTDEPEIVQVRPETPPKPLSPVSAPPKPPKPITVPVEEPVMVPIVPQQKRPLPAFIPTLTQDDIKQIEIFKNQCLIVGTDDDKIQVSCMNSAVSNFLNLRFHNPLKSRVKQVNTCFTEYTRKKSKGKEFYMRVKFSDERVPTTTPSRSKNEIKK